MEKMPPLPEDPFATRLPKDNEDVFDIADLGGEKKTDATRHEEPVLELTDEDVEVVSDDKNKDVQQNDKRSAA